MYFIGEDECNFCILYPNNKINNFWDFNDRNINLIIYEFLRNY